MGTLRRRKVYWGKRSLEHYCMSRSPEAGTNVLLGVNAGACENSRGGNTPGP